MKTKLRDLLKYVKTLLPEINIFLTKIIPIFTMLAAKQFSRLSPNKVHFNSFLTRFIPIFTMLND
jgi:hypothetical protein